LKKIIFIFYLILLSCLFLSCSNGPEITAVFKGDASLKISAETIDITEGGSPGSFSVSLTSRPKSDVSISFQLTDTSQAILSPKNITFTPDNYNTAQAILVTGLSDCAPDGDQVLKIIIADVTSNDSRYQLSANSLLYEEIDLTVRDDITGKPELLLLSNNPTLQTTESGGDDKFLAALSCAPSAPVTVYLTSSNMAEGILDIQSVTLDSSNYSLGRLITVTGQSDCTNEADISYSITADTADEVDNSFDFLSTSKPAVNQNVILSPSIMVIQSSGQVNRGAGTYNNFQAKLSCEPSADEIMSVAVNGLPNGYTLFSPLASTHTFTAANWNAPVDVILQVTSDLDGAYQVDLSSTTYGSASVYFGDSGTKRLTINVTGLAGKTTLKNGSDSISFQAPGTFYWHLATGIPYALELSSQPTGQICAIKEQQYGTTTLPFTININCVSGQISSGNFLNIPQAPLNIPLYQGKVSNFANYVGPDGITTEGTNLYVGDNLNNNIVKSAIAAPGFTDFITTAAVCTSNILTTPGLISPLALANDGTNLYIGDHQAHAIFKYALDGSGPLTQIAGTGDGCSSVSGGSSNDSTNPLLATFNGINSLAFHDSVLYISEWYGKNIRKLDLTTGEITTIHSSATNLGGLVVVKHGATDFLYFSVRNQIKRYNLSAGAIDNVWVAGTVAGFQDGDISTAKFSNVVYMTTDGQNLFLSDYAGRRVRKINLKTEIVSTIAGNGSAANYGASAQTGIAAGMTTPRGITTDGRSLFLADRDANMVAKITDNGLVGYWPLAGNANDYGNDGASTPVGVWTGTEKYFTGRFNEPEGATNFDGSNYISTKDISFANNAPIAITAWIKPSDVSVYRAIVGKTNYEFNFSVGTGGTLVFQSWDNGGTTKYLSYSSAGIIKTGVWTQVAYVYRGAGDGGGRVYVNGHDVTLTHWEETGNPPIDRAENVLIGHAYSNNNFLGSIAAVRFYNRALNEGEINELAQDADPALVGPSYNEGATGLLSHYSFDDVGGSPSLADNGPLNYTLTTTNAPTATTGKDGDTNGVYDFTRTDASTGQNLQTTPITTEGIGEGQSITLSAWINPKSLPKNDGDIYVIAARENGNDIGYIFELWNSAGVQKLLWSPSVAANNISAPVNIPLNTWSHVAVVQISGAPVLYLNGKALSGTSSIGTNLFKPAVISTPMYIGRRTSDLPHYFDGKIDDVRIYNRALSGVEVRQLAVQVPAGLVARYDFTGDANDVSGFGNHLTPVNSPVNEYDRLGSSQAAYSFDGFTQYLEAPTTSILPIGNSARTMCAWFNPDDNPVAPNQYPIVHQGTSTIYPEAHYLAFRNDGPNLVSSFWGDEAVLNPIPQFLPGSWHFLCGTHGAAENKLYLNGALIASGPVNTIDISDGGLMIGGSFTGSYFKGDIDDVVVYNRALKPAEIFVLGERPGQKISETAGGVSFNMAFVPPKTFYTGTDDSGTASVSNAYWIGETEVTYELWYEVYQWATGSRADGGPLYIFANPGTEGHDGIAGAPPTTAKLEPVTNINWRDAMIFANALTEYYNVQNGTSLKCVYTSDATLANRIFISTNNTTVTYGILGSEDDPYVNPNAKGFRLPTSNEWELAARYIDDANYDGDILDSSEYYPGAYASGATLPYTDFDATSLVAWFGNSTVYGTGNTTTTHNIASKLPNALGLFDMSGNVYEWAFDWYPGSEGTNRVHRGGSWVHAADIMRVGFVNFSSPYFENNVIGFRLARTP